MASSKIHTFSISIITVSYNTPVWLWEKMITAVQNQEYPKDAIEHIVMDAGSTNGSIEYLRSKRIRPYIRKDLLEKPLARMGLGICKAKNDIVLFLEPDNIMVGKTWLKDMIQPFYDTSVDGAYSMYNFSEKTMPVFTRYCALFGINDPLVLYLKKSDKLPQYETQLPYVSIVRKTSSYDVVRFSEQDLPTLGDNGHMVRRSLIQNVYKNPYDYVHTDAFALLQKKGHSTFAVVRNSITHFTGDSVFTYFKRRIEYKKRYFDTTAHKRAYKVFDASSLKDKFHIVLYIFYSLTFIEPLSLSIRGFMVKRDIAWFLHPVVCFAGVIFYGYSEARRILGNLQRQETRI